MKADQGHLEESRKEFEAWFEPCEHNRESLNAWRAGEGYRLDAPYLNGCWHGWLAASSLQEERLARMREALLTAREFIETVHEGEYGYSECTRDDLVEWISGRLEE